MNKLILSALITATLSGCSVTGSHLSTGDANTVSTEDVQLPVNLFPLNAANVRDYSPQVLKKREFSLEQERYQYKIGVGDVLSIVVYDHHELNTSAGTFRSSQESGNWVHADGTIFYPHIGKVSVEGHTVSEVRDVISKRLAKYIEKPKFGVSVAAFRSQKVYITGEIGKPGQVEITNVPLTLLDAVNKTGGITENADWKNVTLSRDGDKSTVSLYEIMQLGNVGQNRLLKHGDVVHIPRNDTQKVFVMGEVNQPQVVKINWLGLNLTEALSTVGGLNELSADATGVFVIRKNVGTEGVIADVYQLDLSDATQFVVGSEFELQPYDVVYITAAPIARWNRLIRQLLPTIGGFNELSEGTLRVRNW